MQQMNPLGGHGVYVSLQGTFYFSNIQLLGNINDKTKMISADLLDFDLDLDFDLQDTFRFCDI